MQYTSSLTDREWEIIEPLLPKRKRTKPPTWSKREILDGILYQLKNGCPKGYRFAYNWVDLPHDLPPYSTVFWHYKQWRAEGTIENIMTELHYQVREKAEKKGNGQP
jgi:transposase